MSTTITAMAESECTLLSLPPEIRNVIYQLVLTVNGGIPNSRHVNIYRRLKRPGNIREASVLALLQTCKQINNEATAIFYLINHIHISTMHLKQFVGAMSVQRLSMIRNISVVGKRFVLNNLVKRNSDYISIE